MGKEAEGDIFLDGDATVIGGGLAKDKGKEGRFSCAVRTDQAEAVLPIDLKGDIAKKSATAEGFAEFGKSEHGWRGKEHGGWHPCGGTYLSRGNRVAAMASKSPIF